MKNIDSATVEGFGHEWDKFKQDQLSAEESGKLFARYFSIFPWERLPQNAEGFDLGCGSGRWARLVAPRVHRLNAIDASQDALNVAMKNLAEFGNCRLHLASVESIPLPDGSQDFGYSLGVLHHIPDTEKALQSCVRKLKVGAPFLLYLYYRFDNRPLWFRAIWRVSDAIRAVISRMPFWLKSRICDLIALTVYWPLARVSKILHGFGAQVSAIPLSSYRETSFYTMRTDALDRFGTRLEQRFTRDEIAAMMSRAGLEDISFSEEEPYWVSIGRRR